MAEGYIKLHRSLLEWELWDDHSATRVLTYLMLAVNWQEKRWMGVTVAPGSLVTSYGSIATRCGLTEKVVRRALNGLEEVGVLVRERAGKGQLVTLVNWDKFQGDTIVEGRKRAGRGQEEGSEMGSERATTKEGKKKEVRRTAIAVPRATTPDEFKAQCAAVAAEHPDLLPPSLRKAFYDYWTERDAQGHMRLQAEKHFEIPRRMTTWRTNAEKRGEIPVPAPERKTGWLTPDGK